MIDHDLPELAAYALGALTPAETRAIEAHLAGCASCRTELSILETTRDLLGEVPPEAFLEGAPPDGDLLLHRTLRAARPGPVRPTSARSTSARSASARSTSTRSASIGAGPSRRIALVAAGIAVLVLGGAVGGLIGRRTAPTTRAEPAPSVSATASASASTVPGTRTFTGTNAASTISLSATVIPALGWVRVHATVTGVRSGTRCQLVVTSRDGTSAVAGTWLASPKGETQGTGLDGAALVAPADVTGVTVRTFAGKDLVSAVS